MLIATRILKVLKPDGSIDVEIRLFKPIEDKQGWICDYEIDWPEGTKKRHAAGVDAIQAILLAFQKVGIQLYTSKYHQAGELSWDGPGRGYGFPVTHNVRDLLVGHDVEL